MKKTIIAMLALLMAICIVACNGNVYEKLLNTAVTYTYTGLEAWEAANCAAPLVKYIGTGSTNYDSSIAPKAKGTYKAVFTLKDQSGVDSIEIPFVL